MITLGRFIHVFFIRERTSSLQLLSERGFCDAIFFVNLLLELSGDEWKEAVYVLVEEFCCITSSNWLIFCL